MADEKKPDVAPTPDAAKATEAAKVASPPAPAPKAEEIVILRMADKNSVFDLSALGLPNVTNEGTAYKRSEADKVLTLAHKYRVRVEEVSKS